jgi:hypothetical protein
MRKVLPFVSPRQWLGSETNYSMRRLLLLVFISVVGTLCSIGCGASPASNLGGVTSPRDPTPTPSPTGTAPSGPPEATASPGVQSTATQPSPPATPATTSGGSDVALGFNDNGWTVTIPIGGHITVSLPATSGYHWTTVSSTNPSTVAVTYAAVTGSGSSADASGEVAGSTTSADAPVKLQDRVTIQSRQF